MTDPEAYALFLQARELGRQGTAEALEQSIALYQQALAIDPALAPAWDWLVDHLLRARCPAWSAADRRGHSAWRARRSRRRWRSTPKYAPAYARLGSIAMIHERDLAAAARHLEQALALDPADLESYRRRRLCSRGAWAGWIRRLRSPNTWLPATR